MRVGLVELLGEGVLTAPSIDNLHEALARATRDMGFDCFALALEIGGVSGRSVLVHDYPASWADVYIGFDLAATDPVRRAAERSVLGFDWRRICDLIPMTEKEQTTFETGRRHGLADGFTVPRHLPTFMSSQRRSSGPEPERLFLGGPARIADALEAYSC